MKTKILILIVTLCVLTGCAGAVIAEGPYLGISSGKYSSVAYRVEGNELLLSFQNNTTLNMTNLVIVVEQQTNTGMNEIQSHRQTLRMNQSQGLVLLIPRNSTGRVSVTAYFVLTTPFAMGAGIGGDPNSNIDTRDVSEAASDHVSFTIAPPQFLIN
jgi:hypothetical protein